MIRSIAGKFMLRIPPVFTINSVTINTAVTTAISAAFRTVTTTTAAAASSSRINTLTSALNKDSTTLLNGALIGTFDPHTIADPRPFWPKDYSASNDASGDVSNTDAGVHNTAADDYSIVDGVEVERMELKKRLYKSYKSRKLSNPSTKSRRRHTQSNR